MSYDIPMFRQQIDEDIMLIQKELSYINSNLSKNEYAFNYWILSRIFNIDEELIPEMVTEYRDKGVDCFVHYEDSKQLYIIQNKYHLPENPGSRKEVADFFRHTSFQSM